MLSAKESEGDKSSDEGGLEDDAGSGDDMGEACEEDEDDEAPNPTWRVGDTVGVWLEVCGGQGPSACGRVAAVPAADVPLRRSGAGSFRKGTIGGDGP